MKALKRYLPDVLVVVLFAAISFVYFMPADIEGRILYQHDSAAGKGLGHEAQQFYEQTGEQTRWSNSAFSGMPTYQTAPGYTSTTLLSKMMDAYHLWLPENVWFVFAYLLGFYILLRAFDFRRSLAVLGSVIWAFSSYFFIIIAAGHLWKVMALAYLPPMIAGIVLAYRGKWLPGFLLTALFSAFEVKANHVQMTYYYLFIILFMVIAYAVETYRQNTWKRFLKASAVCAMAALVGISINMSNLFHTWQYSKESMRGKSELVKKNAQNQSATGLDRDYITQWSYGIGETWTLLVPNAKGGASVPLAQNQVAMEKANPDFMPIYQQLGQYWGEQPGTSGPVYVGAFVLMLFLLGCFVVRGPIKWALVAATVLSVLLSWGKNFMPFTDFFIDYIPMYSKFRTVASILVIAEFTIPLLAMLALKLVVEERNTFFKVNMKYVYASFALTAGFCFLFAIAPSVFFSSFISSQENTALQSLPAEYVAPVMQNLTEVRQSIFTADAWRSFFIIVVGTGLLMLFRFTKTKPEYITGGLLVLCLLDMWTVNKRYLNDAMFVDKSVREAPQPMTDTDRQILKDQTLDYRVLNLASNTFNENETSYYHKSIGGYHAAKLRRYQDLIDAYLAPEMRKLMPALAQSGGDMFKLNGDSIFPVLNMLNTRYFIIPLQDNKTVPLLNPYCMGNAWFVDKLHYVDNANAEIEQLGKMNLRKEAVADKRFADVLKNVNPDTTQRSVTLTTYKPNELTYSVTSAKGGVVVFSEIYYPEWTATIDGQPAELGRANYVLRALQVPAGKHTVVLRFDPASIRTTETVAYVAYVTLLVALLYAGFTFRKRKLQQA